MTGFIYAVRGREFDAIKIGYAGGCIETRIKIIQSTLPFAISWIGYGHGTRDEEKEIHRALSWNRIRADWYLPTEEVLACIARHLPNAPTICAQRSPTSHRMLWRRVLPRPTPREIHQ